jgi:1-acyl-sn-glycerol-3-phosphate acyltransferase
MARSEATQQATGPMQYTIFDIPVLRDILRLLAILILKMIGWRKEGSLPHIAKYVIILAPHTSNWDFFIGLAIAFALKLRAYWLGKDRFFRWPFHGVIRWLGGIPIDRSHSSDVVAHWFNPPSVEHIVCRELQELAVTYKG